MKKKTISSIALSIAAAAGAFGFAGCGGNGGDTYKDNYNIIMTNSSLPPMVASLYSIKDGNDTYAYVQRGKTFAGIDMVNTFHNSGFKTDKNNNQFTQAEVAKMAEVIQQIATKKTSSKFTIYVTDYNAYTAYAAAYQAGLSDNRFEVKLCEDGSSTYSQFYTYFVAGKTTAGEDQPYKKLEEKIAEVETKIDSLKDSNGRTIGADVPLQDYFAPYALATYENCEYYTQSLGNFKAKADLNANISDSKIYEAFGLVESSTPNIKKLNIKFNTVSQLVQSLTPEQKVTYQTLMLGKYRQNAIDMFTRETLSDGVTRVPSKKLVYVGNRAAGQDFGRIADLSSLPSSYSELPEEIKITLSETDYNIVMEELNNSEKKYTDIVKLTAFNKFMDYRYTYWYTKTMFGEEYDILYKGHPSEEVGDRNTWEKQKYSIGEGSEDYTDAMFNLVKNFYEKDSLGKTIGVLPGGVAVENFAFLDGINFSVCSGHSSFLTGFETSVPIEYVTLAGSSASTIMGDSQLKTRYTEGTLKNSAGESTVYLNEVAVYQSLYKKYEDATATQDVAIKNYALNKYKACMAKTFGITQDEALNYLIDNRGVVKTASNEDISRTISYNLNDDTSAKVTKTIVNGADPSEFTIENPTREGYVFMGWKIGENAWVPHIYNEVKTSEIEVVAQWKKISSLTLKATKDSAEVLKTIDVYEGANLEELSKDIKNPAAVEGKTYRLVWHNATDDSVVTEMPSSDVTLYAEWIETVTVKYYLKKGGAEAKIVVDADKTWQDVVNEINKIKGLKNPDGNETKVDALKRVADDQEVTLTNKVDSTAVYVHWDQEASEE